MFQLFFLVQCEWLGIAQESRKKQASPRVDVDEAPYAPGNDLLHVTELEDAHDPIKLLKSDDNLEFFFTETLPMPDSDGILDSATKLAWMIRTLLSRSPVSSHVNLKTKFLRYENRVRALSSTARAAGAE